LNGLALVFLLVGDVRWTDGGSGRRTDDRGK
jgi:hypothetical protein